MSSAAHVRPPQRPAVRLGAVIASLLLTAAAPVGQPQHLRLEPLEIATDRGVARFHVQIADTGATREKGLMFVHHLSADEGMLFDFKAVQPVSFWMKNTLVPLDMVFIAADGRVVSIAHDAVPMDLTPIPSGGAVLGVLEIRGGRAAELHIEPGDKVRERIFTP